MSSVVVSSEQTPNIWQLAGAVELRIYANQSFHTSDGKFVPQGTIDSKNYYAKADVSVTTQVATLPTLTLASSENSLTNQQATYSAYFYDKKTNKRVGVLLERFTVSPALTPTTWPLLTIHKMGVIARLNNDTYTKQAIDAMFATMVNAAPLATDAIYGRARMVVPAANSADPVVVPDNDPRVNFAVNGKSGPYNLVGDGIADDTVGLLLAWAQPGRIVEIPKGIFKVTQNFPAPLCAELLAAGRDQTIFKPSAAVTTFLTLQSAANGTSTRGHGFAIDLTNAPTATGLVLGNALTGDGWGGLLSQISIKNASGAGGVGLRIGDALKAELTGILLQGNETNLLAQQFSNVGNPTTVTLRNSQIVNAIKKGAKLIDGHSLTFDGVVFESNGEEGAWLNPGAGTLENVNFLNGCWFEANYNSDPSKFQMLIDGTGGGTVRAVLRDAFFTSSAAKSYRATGAGATGLLLDQVQVPNVAGTIQIDTHAYGRIANWPRNLPVSCLANTTRTGTTPSEGFEFPQGPGIDWTPVFSSDLGNAAITFNGAVTIARARFFLEGKRIRIELEWFATLNAVTPAYIAITLPTGVMTQSNQPLITGAAKNNNSFELGRFRPDGSNSLLQYRTQQATYTSAGLVGGEFNNTIEIQ